MKSDPIIPKLTLGTPDEAYAGHAVRMSALASAYAEQTPLPSPMPMLGLPPLADENNGVALIAHLHRLGESKAYRLGDRVPGSIPEHQEILDSLRALRPQAGMGTSFDKFPAHRDGDYDMGIKCLMVIACRYRSLLAEQDLRHIVDLLPIGLRGGYDMGVDTIPILPGLTIDETENHRLMIHGSRYLANQLLLDRTGDGRFDNQANGLARWLVESFMATIARHDFLEFNARGYNRLSLHAILNLYEFARDPEVVTAAHILLDYIFMKFAVSSSRMRRVNPFRRLREHINSLTSKNDLVRDGIGGDPVTGMFLAFSGMIGEDGKPLDWFPMDWTFNALLAGLTPYRPPPAAYHVAMHRPLRAPVQHRFYHGDRPALPAAGEAAEGGVEIYYRSPSFLMSAGGMFLNSGYGHDELPFNDFAQVAIAQATTLIPVRADAKFADLIRFESYPDWRRAVNTGVHLGFMCGANLRPAPARTLPESSSHGPALAGLGPGTGTLLAWKGSGNEGLNLAEVFTTSKFGLVGVEGVFGKRTYGDTSEVNPAVAAGLDRVFLGWRGAGNTQLNLLVVKPGPGNPTKDPEARAVLPEFSEHAPALAFHAGAPVMAWTGGANRLNLARVALAGPAAGPFTGVALAGKVTLGELSDAAPALCSHGPWLAMAWKGHGNDRLNVAVSTDGGRSFRFKRVLGDTSVLAPAIASHQGKLFLAWTGQGDGHVNVARIAMNGPQPLGVAGHVVLADTSEDGPALASTGNVLVLGWRGSGNDQLNLRASDDGRFRDPPAMIVKDLGSIGIHLAAYRTPVANAADLDTPIESLGFVYAQEANITEFSRFESRVRSLNAGLPARLEYGGSYVFHAPDGRDFAFRLATDLQPGLDKYTPRVELVGDPRPLASFRDMALVEGRWLSSPDGHAGAIEIRHPNFEDDPVVLDFRDPLHPVRADNLLTCPNPWAARAQALADYAPVVGKDDPWQGQRARLQAIDLYFRLLESDFFRFSTPLVEVFMATMAAVGIDFTAPPTSLGAWLIRPAQYSHGAIVEALVGLADGRTFYRKVSLDTIVKRYEATPGVTRPAGRGAVDPGVLAAATIAAFADRYASVPVGAVGDLMV
ncbi:MAG: hypothetical protein ABTQ27_10130 [Amaricoccus sp.]|uniref:hypothetical protein n=1 Tax=Amaricoccus sp. TaxID=1872485 RepID=UPI003314D749